VEALENSAPPTTELPPHVEKTQSMPVIATAQTAAPTSPTGLFGLKLAGRGNKGAQVNVSSPTIDAPGSNQSNAKASSTSIDTKKEIPAKHRLEKSSSFFNEPTTIVSTETVNADAFKPSPPPGESLAASAENGVCIRLAPGISTKRFVHSQHIGAVNYIIARGCRQGGRY
jgi:hypothetical protein